MHDWEYDRCGSDALPAWARSQPARGRTYGFFRQPVVNPVQEHRYANSRENRGACRRQKRHPPLVAGVGHPARVGAGTTNGLGKRGRHRLPHRATPFRRGSPRRSHVGRYADKSPRAVHARRIDRDDGDPGRHASRTSAGDTIGERWRDRRGDSAASKHAATR
jgi:hypothetical protein